MSTDPLGTVHAYMDKANEFLSKASSCIQEATFLAALPPPKTESALRDRFQRIQEVIIQANTAQEKYLTLKDQISTEIPRDEKEVAQVIVFSKNNNLNNLNKIYKNSLDSLNQLIKKIEQQCIEAGLFENNPQDMPRINIYALRAPSSVEISEIATTILKKSATKFSKIVTTCFSVVREISYEYIGKKITITLATVLLLTSIGIPISYMEFSKNQS